jgi:hypothetical protein
MTTSSCHGLETAGAFHNRRCGIRDRRLVDQADLRGEASPSSSSDAPVRIAE